MTFKVISTSNSFGIINQEPYQRLVDNGCEVILNKTGKVFTEDQLISIGKDADAVLVGHGEVTPKVIKALKNVKIYAKHGVGYDNIDLETTKGKNIFVTNVPGSNSNEVADLVFGLILSIARHIPIANAEVKQGIWKRPKGLSLYKKTIGIIGTGDIGVAVARRAAGFSMKVLAYDLSRQSEIEARGGKYQELEELLQQSDFITLHLPVNKETKYLLNKETFGLMKTNAVIINTARAELIELGALNEALLENKIFGFGTDVFNEEPPPLYDFFQSERVVVTPHIGAATIDANLNMGNGAVDSILAIKDGKRPPQNYIRNGV